MTDKTKTSPVPEAFAALGVRPSILKALAEAKFETPSEIQNLLIPRALAGVDLLGQARTGTGKTAAFGIPILQRAQRGLATQALILVPTRELAVQVEAEIKRLGQYTPIRSVPVYGGQKITAQLKFLRNGPEIVVGTPGRVIDLLDRRLLSLENVRFVVLDEVDRMLDIGFRDDIRNILSRVKGVRRQMANSDERREGARDEANGNSADDRDSDGDNSDGEFVADNADGSHGTAPSGRHQTIFVSATFTDEIEKLARRFMHEPIEKLVASGADDRPTVEEVEQYYLSVPPWDKYRLLRELLLREAPELAIVFCRTKHGAEKIAARLYSDGIQCREIHGNLAQAQREKVMKGFRTGKFDVLIATDLASRGIDVADITHIINFDIPEDPEIYVHRVGRTARMGAKGKAFTLVTPEQGDELTKIESIINMIVPQATVEGFVPRPPPSDWTDLPPGAATSEPSKPVIGRFERAYGTSAGPNDGAMPVALPPRTIGSKIPVTRRHRKRR